MFTFFLHFLHHFFLAHFFVDESCFTHVSFLSLYNVSLDVTLTCIKQRRRRHTHTRTLYHPFTLFLSRSPSSFGCHLVTLKMYRPKLMICVRVSCGSLRTQREGQTGNVMMLHHNELYSFRYVLVHTAKRFNTKTIANEK